ncbi:CIR protein PIR protein [Plasmodium vinckei petteri]|uniref:CIR protein PIR protein n=1 Tax=Plasmodium vinckei petteri TaxID=138298 RepID=A0A6V7SZS1_PLAVN|nr:CIR protein PIR protein [Plasmodium vinckei petteri]
MAKYSIEDLYKEINTINGYFGVDDGEQREFSKKAISTYCRHPNAAGFCPDYLDMASSGVIFVLKNLKKYNLEDDKLAEYAILWLRYKLNQKTPHYNTQLNEFYTKYIQKNKHYNKKINGDGSPTYKEIIDTKKDLMDINEMTKFSYPFKILLFLYSEINKNSLNCTKRSNYPKEFAKEFDKLNKDSNNIEDSSYNKMLSILSDDYNNLKNKYDSKNSCNFPPLTQLTPQKRPAEISEKGSGKNSLESSLEKSVNGSAQISVEKPVDKSVGISGKDSGQMLGEALDVTSSSSSILSTLIPGLSVVSVIPVFLGIAYKVNNKELKTIIFL